MDYKTLYFGLFNSMTDALEAMEAWNFGLAQEILRRAQIEAEEAYLSQGEEKEAPV